MVRMPLLHLAGKEIQLNFEVLNYKETELRETSAINPKDWIQLLFFLLSLAALIRMPCSLPGRTCNTNLSSWQCARQQKALLKNPKVTSARTS